MATDQKETWLAAVGRAMATWGVSHASLEGSMADLVARAVKAERERCAAIVHRYQIAHCSDACGWALDHIKTGMPADVRAAPAQTGN